METFEQRTNGHHGHLRALGATAAAPVIARGVDPAAASWWA
jgi:hypothetical protein